MLLEITRLRAENEAKSVRIDALSIENETLQAETLRMSQRIAYLERMLYGTKSDKLSKLTKQAADQPTLFDRLFDEAMDERDKAIAHIHHQRLDSCRGSEALSAV